ncbi:hypothetical protein [Campylobacter canadensis]|uniref:hypothetical protein n=1 Tax=Campylobacter canadensis TaxID=449520 RepID=UPI001CCA4A39|nr:hypothetical protein [Campylobacter canadensis]MBZ7998899.1 hypothetical protein [Campylobacter canadensis]
MQKFENINWIFKKNSFAVVCLLIFIALCSFYINYLIITEKLAANNDIVANKLSGQLAQSVVELELIASSKDSSNPYYEKYLKNFNAIYIVNANGDVIDNIKKNENESYIKKFIEINKDNIKTQFYQSELLYSQDIKPSFFIAIKKQINNSSYFIVGQITLKTLINNINTNTTDFVIIDKHSNILYSSSEQSINQFANLNALGRFFLWQDILYFKNYTFKQNTNAMNGFFILSFIPNSSYLNINFLISVLIIILILLYLWNIYLDKMYLKIALYDKLNNILILQKSANLEEEKYKDKLLFNDLQQLEEQTNKQISDLNEIREEYKEAEQRISSMFNNNSIPMLKIDAYTTKILAANVAALDFYNIKLNNIIKFNLYMLGKKSYSNQIDPINFAYNMQNNIKNQGLFITTTHFVDEKIPKNIRIYPFIMRSSRVSYDFLMILDSEYQDNMKNTMLALDNSFVVNINFILNSNMLKITSFSPNLNKILGIQPYLQMTYKELLFEDCENLYLNLLLHIKQVKQNKTINNLVKLEQIVYLRQNNKSYSQFKASYYIYRENTHDTNIHIISHLALLKSNLNPDNIRSVLPYNDVYQNINTKIGVFDENFNCISMNKELRNLLRTPSNVKPSIKEIINNENIEEIIGKIKNNTIDDETTVYLKDLNNILHPCTLFCTQSKNSNNEIIYCIVFRQNEEIPDLDKFINKMLTNNFINQDFFLKYLDCYINNIKYRVLNKISFGTMDFENLLKNIDLAFNIFDENTQEKMNLLKQICKNINLHEYENIEEYILQYSQLN